MMVHSGSTSLQGLTSKIDFPVIWFGEELKQLILCLVTFYVDAVSSRVPFSFGYLKTFKSFK